MKLTSDGEGICISRYWWLLNKYLVPKTCICCYLAHTFVWGSLGIPFVFNAYSMEWTTLELLASPWDWMPALWSSFSPQGLLWQVCIMKSLYLETGGMASWLRTLPVDPEILGLVLCSYTATQNLCSRPVTIRLHGRQRTTYRFGTVHPRPGGEDRNLPSACKTKWNAKVHLQTRGFLAPAWRRKHSRQGAGEMGFIMVSKYKVEYEMVPILGREVDLKRWKQWWTAWGQRPCFSAQAMGISGPGLLSGATTLLQPLVVIVDVRGSSYHIWGCRDLPLID